MVFDQRVCAQCPATCITMIHEAELDNLVLIIIYCFIHVQSHTSAINFNFDKLVLNSFFPTAAKICPIFVTSIEVPRNQQRNLSTLPHGKT